MELIKRDIYILGAGGFAREIYSYLSESKFKYEGSVLKGFLTDYKDDLDDYNCAHKIVGNIKDSNLDENSLLIMGISDCAFKQEIYDFYKVAGFDFLTYKHSTAIVGNNVSIGEGSVLGPNTILTTDIKVGKCTTINAMSSLGHDVKVGNFCTFSGHCDITGNVEIGDSVLFGTRVSVIPYVKIGSNSIIGAGSLVIRRVKQGITVFGNPAKKII